MKAYVIDAAARDIREVGLSDSEGTRMAAMNNAVGGCIELAHMWTTGDVLYVDEDGRRHDPGVGFVFQPTGVRFPRSLTGSGVVVGREIEGDQYPDGWTNLDPAISADELRQSVRFWP